MFLKVRKHGWLVVVDVARYMQPDGSVTHNPYYYKTKKEASVVWREHCFSINGEDLHNI
jgi:hypothetical protein